MNTQQQALERWLEARIERWKWMESWCSVSAGAKSDSGAKDVEFVEAFRALGRDLALARCAVPGTQLTRYLSGLYMRCREELYREPASFWHSLKDAVLHEVPAVVREMRGAILATVLLFLLSIFCGWWLVSTFPELISLFASQQMIDTVQSGALWTDDLLNILPSSVLAFSIITNNVIVTLTAFVLGTFYGLGTFYIIALNGLMLGGVFAFTGRYYLDQRLLEFIIGHGVVELSVICLAGAAGVYLGEALIRPGDRRRADAFRYAISRATTLLVVVVPFLIGAGIIEGYVSPNDSFTFPVRLAIGLVYGTAFWLVLAGGCWSRQKLRAVGKL